MPTPAAKSPISMIYGDEPTGIVEFEAKAVR